MLKKSYGLNMQHLDFAALLSVIPSPCLPFSDLCNPPLKCWSMYLKAQDSPHNLCSRKGGTMFKIKLWVEDQKTSINFTFYAIFSSKEAVLFGYQLAEHGFYPLPLGKPAGRGPGGAPLLRVPAQASSALCWCSLQEQWFCLSPEWVYADFLK